MKKVELISSFIQKSREGDISPEEQKVLSEWLLESDENSSLYHSLTDSKALAEKLKVFSEADSEDLWLRTRAKIQPAPVVELSTSRKSWMKYAAAAAIILLVGGGAWYYLGQERSSIVAVEEKKTPAAPTKNLIMPGSSKATLLLADGKRIELDGANNNGPIQESGVVISNRQGHLEYNIGGQGAKGSSPVAAGSVLYNTVSTPNGGEYQVTLPDGSIVWLNAASSLRFPIAFAGSERNVLLTGEAFFEVRHMSDKPFTVSVQTPDGIGGKVQVLGTHFNVNAYGDESDVKTTLLEGSVRVTANATAQQVVIRPGEQASVSAINGLRIRKGIDTAKVVAWKKGFLSFNGATVQELMREIERWYNVTVEYRGKVPVKSSNGDIQRNSSLSEIVELLRINRVNIELKEKERKIIITA